MKQAFVVISSCFFLISGFLPKGDMSQLILIPEAIEHYEEHKAELLPEDSFCFVEFFIVHYLSPDQHEGDHDNEHEKLPLQHINTSMVLAIVDFHMSIHQMHSPEIELSQPWSTEAWAAYDIVNTDIQPPRV